MSAVMVTDSIYDTFRSEKEPDKTFYHGHTFCGNPISSAVSLAALSAYKEENVLENSRPKIAQLKTSMEVLAMKLNNSSTLTLGMIGVVEINDESGAAERARRIARRAYELGLFIRPLARSVYLWPPLTPTEDELSRMFSVLKTSIEQTANLK